MRTQIHTRTYRTIRASALSVIALTLALTLGLAQQASAQAASDSQGKSIAVEADIISFFIAGYSGILNLSLANGFQIALGTGRYDVPSFLLEGDANFETAQWQATSTSVQVLRAGYRFNGPMKNGPALAAVILNENWRLRSESLGGETHFRPFRVGLSGGYYQHIGRHFYVYPTVAFTYNNVISGETFINDTHYKVERFAPNGSVHVGWEWTP